MHFIIAAIGKSSNSPEETLISGYLKRLQWKVDLRINDGRKLKSTADETAWLLAETASAEKRIALDERGKELNSEEFAKMLANLQERSVASVAFIIGGADGLDKPQLPKSTELLCFGRMTWPHLLVRAMLAEQLYRADAILRGHPYHRGVSSRGAKQ